MTHPNEMDMIGLVSFLLSSKRFTPQTYDESDGPGVVPDTETQK